MKEEILESFFINMRINPLAVAKPKYKESPAIIFLDLIESIFDNDGKYLDICKDLGIAKTTYFNLMRRLFPAEK